MRPYLAVFKDSFREALASRILWLITGLITLILFVGLAPFALREETAYRFQRNEFRNGPEFLQFLATQESAKTPSAAQRIWSRLPESLRHRLHSVSPTNLNEQLEVLRDVRAEFNGMVDNKELYDPKLWPTNSLTGEGRRLAERGWDDLSSEEQRRFNRLLIDAAFPDHVVSAPGRNLYAEWFGYRLGAPLPFEPRQLTLLVNYALAVLMTFLAGILGVLIAILVTAPTVPQTFEPGAIDLLLSKPVSRSVLFLTKFFGASVFILLNSIYLIGGMWLIAGLRFDIWSGRLLLCIPVFLFLFVIYYSISALTGVIWRNAIVSVCCTALFWGVCFTVGTAKHVAEDTFLDPIRVSAIIPAGEKLLSVNRSGQTFEWAADHQAWDEVFRGRDEGGARFFFRPSLLGPVYDPVHHRIAAIESPRTRFELFGGSGKLLIGDRSQEWRRMENAVTPSNPQALLIDPKGQIIVVSLTGIFRFQGDAAHEHKPFKVFGVDISPQDTGKFERIGPNPEQKWHRPFSAAINHEDGRIAVFSHGILSILTPDSSGNYTITREAEIDTEKGGIVEFVGTRLALATGDGHVRILDSSSLSEEVDLKSSARSRPRKLAGAPDGRRLAVLFDDGYVLLYDVDAQQPVAVRIGSQGDITAIAFSPEDRLLAADGFGRVVGYRLDPFERGNSYQSPPDTLQVLYRYVVTPLYTIFPKPGEMNDVVTYLVVGDPIDLFVQNRTPREEQNPEEKPPVDIWPPIISNVIFLAVVLTITCVYIERRDF
jgi:ABC-2 family transporter protein